MSGLLAHLATGSTTVCRAWAVTRGDGVVLGFTDHDRDLAFEGVAFRADTGMSAQALQQTTGLAVDNAEAVGALSDAAVTEADLLAGRYDGAEVRAWLVNWARVEERVLQFRGHLGEIVRSGGAFRAELRGLTEALNQPRGRSYQRSCAAILGDADCGFDLARPGFAMERAVEVLEGARVLRWSEVSGYPDRWFEKGRLTVVSGTARGAVGLVKNDRAEAAGRMVALWQEVAALAPGDVVRLEPGCDRRAETCRGKFGNFLNFRGFPHVPGEDWLMSYPVSGGRNDGGRR